MPHPLASASLAGALAALALAGAAQADAPAAAYPDRAPIEQYRMGAADEAALARSAAPASISADAEVLVMGDHGYEVAAPGKNGFVCLVERSWTSSFGDAEFWNPKERGPICYNPAGARTVLPANLERTRWVLEGDDKARLVARTRAAVAAGRIGAPAPGAMAIMMSPHGYLNDDAAGPWHPHIMIFLPPAAGAPATWGANLPGAPVSGATDDVPPVTTLFIPVRRWSDGTPDPVAAMTPMQMGPAPATAH